MQPEHLTDLVSSDAQTESGKLDRWIRGDNMTEALRVLDLDGERKELFDIHIEHVTVFFDDALMHKLAVKIDPNATRDLVGKTSKPLRQRTGTLMRVSGAPARMATLPMICPKSA